MRHDHIKAFISRFRKGKFLPFHQISVVIESSQYRFWVGYTTSTEKWPERFKRQAVVSSAYHRVFEVPERNFRLLVSH